MLDIKKIKDGAPAGCKIFHFEECDSTNTRAKEYAKEHPSEKTPAVFIAERQTAGRGRLGRSFHSAEGAGIYISFLIYPETSAEKTTKITPYLAVKLAESVESVSTLSPKIKWVNDLYTNGKKLAGILVESQFDKNGKIDYLVCGLGINVYKTALPKEISDIAISIEEAIGYRLSREALTLEMIKRILSDLDKIGTNEIFSAYKSRLTTIGQNVTVIKPSGSYEAFVRDLNPDYSLLLKTESGEEEALFTGEVSIRAKS